MLRFSIIINTANRADSLERTLESLQDLDYPSFEVIVVNGPSTDHTDEVLTRWDGRIKVGQCTNLNLAESRNIGIALAAGDVLAFIDDDAYPDPAWLDRLAEGYDSDEVVGVGGPVYDHTGASLQARYNLCTRLGVVHVTNDANPAPYLSAPHAETIPYLIGTNSSYRREQLIEIGGFDEEFEYYLDDADVCARLTDRGWYLKFVENAFVYHKFLESHLRTPARNFNRRYPIIKNKLYFALKFGLATNSVYEVCRYFAAFIEDQRQGFDLELARGSISAEDYAQFERDVPAAFDAAFARHVSGIDPTRQSSWFAERQTVFQPFETRRRREDKLHVCFFSLEYPPQRLAGIGRVIHLLATGLAARGHVVRVLTPGEGHDRVDLEQGVWVHRTVPKEHSLPEGLKVPPTVWNYTASLRDELRRVHEHRAVDIVQFPNWGSQGIAALLDGGFTTVLGLYTPLRTISPMDPRLALDSREAQHVADMTALEDFCYHNADAFLACGPSIVEEIESQYDVKLSRDRLGFVAHGLADASVGIHAAPEPGKVNVLYVGRLEPRKGIGVLLSCIPSIARAYPNVTFTIVGDDSIPGENGVPYRTAFEQSPEGKAVADRVTFYGSVDDDELWGHYARCDVFVCPSLFESFGLILVEAMMFAKPVIACTVGGMREIVEEGANGFLVPPNAVEPLRGAIERLVRSPEIREHFGRRSRELYEERYSVERMTEGANRFYDKLLGRDTASVR